MRYVIVNIAEALSHGIYILPTQRHSLDGSKAVIHEEMVDPVDEFNQLKRYNFDDPEFLEIINGPEWVAEEGTETPPDENFGKVLAAQIIKNDILKEINTFDLKPQDALTVIDMYPEWKTGIEVKVKERYRTSDTELWECISGHTTQENWKPSISTSSLWKRVDVDHKGTQEDPIPYSAPMEIFEGKYYTEKGILYKCTRNSGIPLSHELSALVGTYVEKIEG